MKNVINIIFVALTIFGLISCDNRGGQKGLAQSLPETKMPKPPDEPYSFKEYKLGMTILDFYKLKPSVTYKNVEKFQTSLFVKTTIAGSGKEAYFLFKVYDKDLVLSSIFIETPKNDFSRVKDAMILKYGSPSRISSINKSNAMGATFSADEFIWINDQSTINAVSIGSTIDKSLITFSHSKLGQSKQEKLESAKAASDI